MKSKQLAVIVALAAISVGGAYLALSKGGSKSSEIARGEPFLPQVADVAPKVVRIELERGGAGETTRRELRKEGDGWILVTSDGYPVRFEEVKGLVAGLTSLKIDDRMTAKKERHGELGLAWTAETPDSSGRGARVRLYTSNPDSAEAGSAAAPVVDVVLGEERANPRAQFVRRFSEDQCWRVLGSVLVDIDPRRWVEAELLAIPDGEVRGVTFNGLALVGTEGADGRVTYAAAENATPLAALATESGTVQWTDARKEVATRTLPNWLSRLELDDVRRAKGGAPDPTLSATFDMVRGTLKMNAVRDASDPSAVWISFEAAPKEGAPSADEINAKKKYPGDPYIPDWKAFAAKHAGWEYKLPGWKLNALEEAAKLPDESADGATGGAADPNQPTRIPSARD
jgi:hypothetical protein